jgi:Alpha/beta hydrolase domain
MSHSRITRVHSEVERVEVGTSTWIHTSGVLEGVVEIGEAVAGLDVLGPDSPHSYRSEFEILAPMTVSPEHVVLVEAENRGRPALLLFAQRIARESVVGSPNASRYVEFGDGILSRSEIAYARIQWQHGISDGVPELAQGVGEVIVRDFARMLKGMAAAPEGAEDFPVFHVAVLAGVSQASWFVNTFIAEGFNVDRSSGQRVFDGAIAISGAGNWLAINQLAGISQQTPYALPDSVPLHYDEILFRPASDPLFIDVATHTDYYRLRAGLTATDNRPSGVFRYDWPAPHASSAAGPNLVFGTYGCANGIVAPLNPTDYTPYLRTLISRLAGFLASDGTASHLPSSTTFELQPAPVSSPDVFNGLPGLALSVPRVDAETLEPLGGVRFATSVAGLGRPDPVCLTPVRFEGIDDICGNWGGWQNLQAEQVRSRYGTSGGFLALFSDAVTSLIDDGYLDEAERTGMTERASRDFEMAVGATN